ncbi:MAG TPA: AI-2E family transporter [Solirubrobacterales bacterium]
MVNPGRDLRDTATPYKVVILGFALLAAGLLFRELVTLIVAILMTVLIAIPLAATATRLERVGIPRFLGALAGLLIGFGVLAAVFALIIPPFVDEVERFADEVPTIVQDLEQDVGGLVGDSDGSEVQDFIQGFVDDPGKLIGPVTSLGISVAGVLGAIALMVITAYYMAVRPEPLVRSIASLFPPSRRPWANHVMDRLRDAWIGWMQGMLADMVITGVLVYIGLSVIGLDFAIFFAVFSAVLVLIPYFGAIIGAIPPVLFALADSPQKALLALAIYVLIQQIEGNITIPLVMADRVRLHPAAVAIGVVIVGQLFGFIGLFVAVPLLSLIIILVDELWVKQVEAGDMRAASEGEAREKLAEAEPEPDSELEVVRSRSS